MLFTPPRKLAFLPGIIFEIRDHGVISNNLAEEITAVWVDDWVYISLFKMGDANGDGAVNAVDITKVERIIAGLD